MHFTMTVLARQWWVVSVWMVLGLVLVRQTADAATMRRANLSIEGYVGQAPADVRPQARLVLQYEGKSYPFDLTRTVVNTGSRSRNQLLQDIKPFQNTLVLHGGASTLGALTNASPGQKLVISGYHRSRSRELSVTQVRPAPTSPTPAAQ